MEFWISREQCTGCAACANVCEKGAIRIQPDSDGYPCPVINQEICTDCGLCVGVCPVLKRINAMLATDKPEAPSPEVYAAWSRDEEIRRASSSGGIFSELAKAVLDNGGAVCGAGYDSNNQVCHKIVTSEELLADLRQSKYVQSQINGVFREIRELLEHGTQVLFCGTACQVAGLREFLGDRCEKLVTIDFICHGVNSLMAYQSWLKELEREYGAKVSRVLFRDKGCGWNAQSTRVDFDNGAIYQKNRYEDLFKRAFLRYELMIRPSCTQCRFKEKVRQADLTLGDFWRGEKELDDDLGTSVVMVNTEKGDALFRQIEQRIEARLHTYEDVLRGNSTLRRSVSFGAGREEFLELLKEGTPFSEAYRVVTGEKEPLLGEIAVLEKDRTFLKGKVERLEKHCAALTEKSSGLEKDRTFLKSKAERLEKHCADLMEKSAGLEKDRTFLKRKGERLEKNCVALNEKTATLEKDRAFLTSKVENLEKSCVLLKEQANVLEKDRAFLTGKTESLEKSCVILKEQAVALKKDRAFLKNKTENLEKNCTVLTEKIAGLEQDCTLLEGKTSRLEKERANLKNELDSLKKDRTFLKRSNQQLKCIVEEYQGAPLARAGLKVHRLFRRFKAFFTGLSNGSRGKGKWASKKK